MLSIFVLSMALITSCKKSVADKPADDTDVLIEANNHKALGKYSGILIGSSGYYFVELRTTGSKATIRFDGATYVLDGQGNIEDGKAVTNYEFQKGDVKLTFTVTADGKSPSVKIEIPGHRVYATINKDTTIYNTDSFVGQIRDSARNRDITPVAINISNNNITGYMKVDTAYYTLNGKLEAGKLNITTPYAPGKTLDAVLNNNQVSGGFMYTFFLSKVD